MNSIDKIVLTILVALACPLCLPLVIDREDLTSIRTVEGENAVKKLIYKGIEFDDYVQDEDGHYWAEICQECVEKYREVLSTELDSGSTARGICGVEGCNNDGEDDEKMHYYIDFEAEFVSFKTMP